MEDLFAREQQILDDGERYLNEIREGAEWSIDEFEKLVNEYSRILRQLRRVTKITDRTTIELNAEKLDLLEKVHYDALTSIYNRRFMEESLERIIKTISRSGSMLGILMIDIDFFKRYNDTYGHSRGDECLKEIAAVLNDSITRVGDFVARYGGEEFIVILPDTDKKGTCLIANRILEKVKACNIPHEKNEVARCVTVSIGAAVSSTRHTHTAQDYIKRADEALYMSKQNGRNRYTFIN